MVAHVPVDSLAEDAPTYYREAKVPERIQKFTDSEKYLPEITDSAVSEIFKKLLAQPTIASKKSIYETYDSRVMTNTVVAPGSDSAVLRVRAKQEREIPSAAVVNSQNCSGFSGFPKFKQSVIASGFPPEATILRAASRSCLALDTPVISGNVSLYNETNGSAILPTPMIGMVGLIENVKNITKIPLSVTFPITSPLTELSVSNFSKVA